MTGPETSGRVPAREWVLPDPARRAVAPITRLAGDRGLRGAGLVATTAVLMWGVMVAGPVPGPLGLLVVATAAAVGVAVLGSPVIAVLALLLASFLRSAVELDALPAEPMVLAVLALVASVALAWLRGRLTVRFGVLEAMMAAYLVWNVVSMLLPHTLPAIEPGSGEEISTYRFVLTGTLVPFLAFVVGRAVFRDERRVRGLLLAVLLLAGWSGLVSIVQFTGPTSLVWPAYILDSPIWPGRAVGIVNQPAVNGLLLVAGFLIAMFLLHRRGARLPARLVLLACAAVCAAGVYLTYTRAVWVTFGLGILLCALFARGARTGFVVTITVVLVAIAVNWSTFVSSDREAGGVGSVGEVEDRLNTMATSLWAIGQEPVTGWGIGRFTALNTYHHKVWDPSISFERGYAIASHQNELGIGAELGLPGLALWLAVLVLVLAVLLRSVRRLPVHGVHGRALGLLALTLFAAWEVAGFTVDLRYLDFANLAVFLLIGAAVGVADVGSTIREAPSERSAQREQPLGSEDPRLPVPVS